MFVCLGVCMCDIFCLFICLSYCFGLGLWFFCFFVFFKSKEKQSWVGRKWARIWKEFRKGKEYDQNILCESFKIIIIN